MDKDCPRETKPERGLNATERLLLRIALLITALTYLGTLRFDFVFDDGQLILQNPFVTSWRYVPQYFSSTLWKSVYPADPGNYYRPLVVLWFRVMYSLFGPRPFGWHLVALTLYVLTAWLVYLVVKELTGEVSVAWLTALIFGLHPMHHEVVSWITGATESLVTIALLGAFLAYLYSRIAARIAWQSASCLLYGIALLCKETAIILPALVFACEWFGSERTEGPTRQNVAIRFRRAIVSVSFYIPVALIYLIVRSRVLGGLGHANSLVPASVWLRTLPSVLTAYLSHWVYPAHLGAFYDVFFVYKIDFVHVVLPLIILIAVAAALWACRKRLDEKMAGFAAAWLAITLAPALDLFVFNPQELVHDRYFYLPSIAAALLTALIITRAAKTRVGPFGLPWHVLSAGLALSVLLALLGARAASFWVDNYTLFSRGHQIAPQNSTALTDLGADLLQRGQIDAAEQVLQGAYPTHSEEFGIAVNLGRVKYARKDWRLAEYYTRQAITLDPSIPDAYFYLGQIQLKENRLTEATENMRRAAELNPYSARFHSSYGIVLQLSGDCAGAAQQFAAALDLNPGDVVTRQVQQIHCRAVASSSQPSAAGPAPL